MKVFKVTSICFGPYDCNCKHRTGYIASIVVATDAEEAYGLIGERINTMFKDDMITMNTRFNHSCEHILTAKEPQLAGILFIDKMLKLH